MARLTLTFNCNPDCLLPDSTEIYIWTDDHATPTHRISFRTKGKRELKNGFWVRKCKQHYSTNTRDLHAIAAEVSFAIHGERLLDRSEVIGLHVGNLFDGRVFLLGDHPFRLLLRICHDGFCNAAS